MRFSILLISSLLGLFPAFVQAHELWVAPTQYQVARGEKIVADLRNGQDFRGVKLPYLAMKIERFDLTNGVDAAEIVMRNGDIPALVVPALGEGVNILAYQSNLSKVSYQTWGKFDEFVTHKDLGVTLADHLAKAFPVENFSEVYRRYSKSLIGVGNAKGMDTQLGMFAEFVALTNPYIAPPDQGFALQLNFGGQPSAFKQVEVFDKAQDGVVAISIVKTDALGRAIIPVQAGHEYMLDAVYLRSPEQALGEKWGAIYESLWANLTFYVPHP